MLTRHYMIESSEDGQVCSYANRPHEAAFEFIIS